MSPYDRYATVIHEHRHPTKLVVAARKGSMITKTRLDAFAPNYEAARDEAQALYPDRLIVVPHLGEQVPSPAQLRIVD